MTGELTALAAAGCFGATHFVNGLVARCAPGLTVSLYAQAGGTAVTAVVALARSFGSPTVSSTAFGALSGVGTGVGVAFLYRAMSKGAFSVVVPVSDLGAVAIPVLVGLGLLHERPSPTGVAGIVLALPAIWLLSKNSPSAASAPGLRDALIAGVGFAVQFLAMAPIPVEAGLLPIVASRVASVTVILPLVLVTGTAMRLPARLAAPAAVAGAGGSVAIVLYWLATHQQLLAVVTVLAALYPAVPVILALIFLRERLSAKQAVGVCGAGAAIALLALT